MLETLEGNKGDSDQRTDQNAHVQSPVLFDPHQARTIRFFNFLNYTIMSVINETVKVTIWIEKADQEVGEPGTELNQTLDQAIRSAIETSHFLDSKVTIEHPHRDQHIIILNHPSDE